MKIVIASNNSGKIQELKALLGGAGLEAVPQSDFGVGEAAETACTFIENALLKARYACRETGLPAIADDSGLVVPALRGAPGIYSSRYAGHAAKAPDNIQKLLYDMKDVPLPHRGAHYHCSLVFMEHDLDPDPLICQGDWEGSVLLAPQGKEGFGYDPIFGLPGGKSVAELSVAEKNKRSHRGKALQELLERLKQKL